MADVRTFIRQILAELDRRHNLSKCADAREAWLKEIDNYRREWDKFVSPGFLADTTPIDPQRAAIEIDKALPEDAILVSDIGVHHNWLVNFCKPTRPNSLIGSMGFGAMGFGVAGVLGAKLAAPNRPCVSVCGDGAFFMHASVLGTVVEYALPVVWVVWNNYAYASIRGLQRGYLDGRELATDFRDPRTDGHDIVSRHRKSRSSPPDLFAPTIAPPRSRNFQPLTHLAIFRLVEVINMKTRKYGDVSNARWVMCLLMLSGVVSHWVI